MARIAGVDIPTDKKIRYSLRYIHGIGPKVADDILAQAGINPETKTKELGEQDISAIAGIIDAGHLVEGALRRQISQNVQRLRDIRCYRGDLLA